MPGRRGRRRPAGRTRAGRRRASRRPTGPTQALRASRARTARSGSAGRRRRRRRSSAATRSCVDGAGETDARPALERRPQRPVADERERALAPALERAGEPQHVLALAQRADAEEARSVRRPADVGPSLGRRRAARSARGRRRSRSRLLFASASGTASTRRSSSHADTATTACARLTVSRVAARTALLRRAFSTSCPCAVTTSGARPASAREQPGGNEEVRVDDVGVEPPRRLHDVDREPRVAAASAAPVDDGARELVPARLELALERGDERAEIRRVRARVHLRDEQDPHGLSTCSVRRTCPRARAGRRRSRRPCSGRGALRAAAGAGCRCRRPSRARARARSRPPPALRSARTRAVRSRWRCSPAGSTRWSSTRSSDSCDELVDADDDALAGLDARSGIGRRPPRSRPGRSRPRSRRRRRRARRSRSISSRAFASSSAVSASR